MLKPSFSDSHMIKVIPYEQFGKFISKDIAPVITFFISSTHKKLATYHHDNDFHSSDELLTELNSLKEEFASMAELNEISNYQIDDNYLLLIFTKLMRECDPYENQEAVSKIIKKNPTSKGGMKNIVSFLINYYFKDFNEKLAIFERKVLKYKRDLKNSRRMKKKSPIIQTSIAEKNPNKDTLGTNKDISYSRLTLLSQINHRLDNILTGEGLLGKDELINIERKIDILSRSMGASELIDEISEKVSKIQSGNNNVVSIHSQKTSIDRNKFTQVIVQSTFDMDYQMDNQGIIGYINSLLQKMTHQLSSTKYNSNGSFGDGSFIKKIFRPFLHRVKHIVLEKNKIDVNHVSWSDFIKIYIKHISDKDQAINHFIGILQKRNAPGGIQQLHEELIEIIIEFSQTNYFHDKQSRVPLANVIQALKEDLPHAP